MPRVTRVNAPDAEQPNLAALPAYVASSAAPFQRSNGFRETDGYVSMLAEHYTNKIDASGARWEMIPDYGREGSAMSIFPVTAPSVNPPENSPHLEYRVQILHPGPAKVSALIAPTQAFVPGRGLRLGFSFDNEPPQIIDALAHNAPPDWEQTVRDNIRVVTSSHTIATPGYHTLKIWMVDPGIVLEKILIDLGGLKPSYLGPPETYHH
jgi:hypothetical protein